MGVILARFIVMIQIVIPCYVYAVMSPIVTNISVTTQGTRAFLHTQWSFTDVGGFDGVIPCTGNNCLYGLIIYFSKQGSPPPETHHTALPRSFIRIKPGTTWSEAANNFAAKFGRSGLVTEEWAWIPKKWNVCIGAARAKIGVPGAPMTNFTDACIVVPQSSVTCSLEGNVEIDHGMLQPGQVDGHKASVNHLLQCTGEATVKLQIIPEMTDLGGGVKSLLIVNDVINGGHFTTTKGTSAIKITSRLSGTAATPGKHSGSTVVLMSVQ